MAIVVKVVGGLLVACAGIAFFTGALPSDTALVVASAGAGLLGVPLDKIVGVFKKPAAEERPKG